MHRSYSHVTSRYTVYVTFHASYTSDLRHTASSTKTTHHVTFCVTSYLASSQSTSHSMRHIIRHILRHTTSSTKTTHHVTFYVTISRIFTVYVTFQHRCVKSYVMEYCNRTFRRSVLYVFASFHTSHLTS